MAQGVPNPHVTQAEVRVMVRMFEVGKTTAEVCRETGRSYPAVRRIRNKWEAGRYQEVDHQERLERAKTALAAIRAETERSRKVEMWELRAVMTRIERYIDETLEELGA